MKSNFGYEIDSDLESLREAKIALEEKKRNMRSDYQDRAYIENMLMLETVRVLLKAHLAEKKKPDANGNGIPDYAEDGKGKNDLKKKKKTDEGKYKSDAQRKAVHAAKAEKTNEKTNDPIGKATDAYTRKYLKKGPGPDLTKSRDKGRGNMDPKRYTTPGTNPGDKGRYKLDPKRYTTEDVDAEWAKVKASNNQIKINKFLAGLDQATAKRLTGDKAQISNIEKGKIIKNTSRKPADPYTHDTNPLYTEGFKIRDKSRGYGVSDKTYKTHDEAKKAAVMKAASTGSEWEVIKESDTPKFDTNTTKYDNSYEAPKEYKMKKEKLEEGLLAQLNALLEGDAAEAEITMAARGIVDELQDMIEKLGKIQNDQIGPLTDEMAYSHGPEQSASFKDAVDGAVAGLLDQARSAKDAVNNAVLVLSGEAPAADMSADVELGGDMADDMESDIESDIMGGDESMSGPEDEPLGRAKR